MLEVSVAMLISAICIIMCYSAYTMTGWYYMQVQKKADQASNILQLNHLLSVDLTNANKIISEDSAIIIELDSGVVDYLFTSTAVIRNHFDQRIDTIPVSIKLLQSSFDNKSVGFGDMVDYISLMCISQQNSYPFTYRKIYSSENLINAHVTN